MKVRRVLPVTLFCLVVLGLIFFLDRPPASWSRDALEGRRKTDTAYLFHLRNTPHVIQAALLYALLSERPSVLFLSSYALGAIDIDRAKKFFPRVEWAPLDDENYLNGNTLTELRRRFDFEKFELFVPELTYQYNITPPEDKTGAQTLIREAERIHLFEEGNASYLGLIPTLHGVWESTRGTGVGTLRAVAREYLAGKVTRKQINGYEMLFFPHLDYYVSRLDLIPDLGEMNYKFLDLRDAWSRLRPTDRSHLLEFLQADVEGTRRQLDASPNPNLLILGSTSPDPKHVELMKRWIGWVVDKRGAGRDLFFKPRQGDSEFPAWLNKTYPGRFHILPDRVPFELFPNNGVEFDQYYVAGLSSVLLHLPPERVQGCFDFVESAPDRDAYVKLKLISSEKVLSPSQLGG